MSIKFPRIIAPIALASLLTGCLILPQPTTYNTVAIPIISTNVIVDSKVDEKTAIEFIVSSLNKPTIVTGTYKENLLKQYQTNGEVIGTISVYDQKGVKVEESKHNPKQLDYIFYNGELSQDSRSKQWPLLYPNNYGGGKNTLPMDINVSRNGDKKTYTISTRARGYYEQKTELKPSLPKEKLKLDVEERFKHLTFNIPWNYEYSGEITLKNNDVTAFANIQRRFKDSFVSTNNKTDSEKYGTFVLSNGQTIHFSLYPYKNVAKLQYSFIYVFSFDEKGNSTFDKTYQRKIENMVSREFNK